MFDQKRNANMIEAGIRETKLGLMTEVDIDLQLYDISYRYTEKIMDELNADRLTQQDIEHLREHQNNICVEVTMRPRVVKPARGSKARRSLDTQL